MAAASLVSFASTRATAQTAAVSIAPATRLCQLTGQWDRPSSAWNTAKSWPDCLSDNSCLPTGNLTEARAGVRGVDLGSSFLVDAQGQVRVLFGDTWPALVATESDWGVLLNNHVPVDPWTFPGSTVERVSSSDSWTLPVTVTVPTDLCDSLSFVLDTDGNYQSFTILDGTGISQNDVPLGALEVPAGGFTVNNGGVNDGNLYAFFITSDSDGCTMFGVNVPCPHLNESIDGIPITAGGRTVLAKWTPGSGKSAFTPIYFTSQFASTATPESPGPGAFMNIAPVLGTELDGTNLDQYLPAGMTTANALFLFGTSNWARLSDVYLAVVDVDDLEASQTTPPYALGKPWPASWYYFTGTNQVTGMPGWSSDVNGAVPLMHSQTAGELSARYVPSLGTWLMLFGGGPRGGPFGAAGVISSTFDVTLVSRTAAFPWGPWSSPHVAFDPFALASTPSGLAGYGYFIHGCTPQGGTCLSNDRVSDPGRLTMAGEVYAPYLVPSTLFQSPDASRATVAFAMSTLNPYEVNLMQMQVGQDTDGDGIADFVDNCPLVQNLDQQDTNFMAEQAIAVQAGCPGFASGCTPPSGTAMYPGVAETGRQPLPSDSPTYVDYWHANFPGDACDPNVSTASLAAIWQSGGHIIAGESRLDFDGYVGNNAGNALLERSLSRSAFCQCPTALSPYTAERLLCVTEPTLGCTLDTNTPFPSSTSFTVGSAGGWFLMDGASDVTVEHLERSDVTVGDGTYDPPFVSENWLWQQDALNVFGVLGPPYPTSLTGFMWSSVRQVTQGAQPAPFTPNAYIATMVSEPVSLRSGPAPCSEVLRMNVLQQSTLPSQPVFGCTLVTNHAPEIGLQTPSSDGAVEQAIAPSSLMDQVASGAAQIVVGDDLSAGPPFYFTGTPALVVQTGSTQVLGGLTWNNGEIAPVGGITNPIGTAPDPPTLVSYAAVEGSLWGLTTVNGGTTLGWQSAQGALGGSTTARVVNVVGDVPSNAQAMVWSRGDGNLWTLDLVPGDHGAQTGEALRLVRLDILGGAAETWRLDRSRHGPDSVFLSASGQGEIVLALSIDRHSEVVLLDSTGRAKWSGEMSGSLLSAPVATSTGVGMPLSRPLPAEGTNLDVRYISRRDLLPGLCGAHWLRAHAAGPGARALRGGSWDDHHGDDRECRR